MNKQMLIANIVILILLVIFSSGCTEEENGEEKEGTTETGTIKVNFHVQEDSTTHFELYVDDELVSEKSQLIKGIYKWSRKTITGTHTVQLIYFWDDWLGEQYDTLTDTFTLNSGEIKIIDWYDYDYYEDEEPIYDEEKTGTIRIEFTVEYEGTKKYRIFVDGEEEYAEPTPEIKTYTWEKEHEIAHYEVILDYGYEYEDEEGYNEKDTYTIRAVFDLDEGKTKLLEWNDDMGEVEKEDTTWF